MVAIAELGRNVKIRALLRDKTGKTKLEEANGKAVLIIDTADGAAAPTAAANAAAGGGAAAGDGGAAGGDPKEEIFQQKVEVSNKGTIKVFAKSLGDVSNIHIYTWAQLALVLIRRSPFVFYCIFPCVFVCCVVIIVVVLVLLKGWARVDSTQNNSDVKRQGIALYSLRLAWNTASSAQPLNPLFPSVSSFMLTRQCNDAALNPSFVRAARLACCIRESCPKFASGLKEPRKSCWQRRAMTDSEAVAEEQLKRRKDKR